MPPAVPRRRTRRRRRRRARLAQGCSALVASGSSPVTSWPASSSSGSRRRPMHAGRAGEEDPHAGSAPTPARRRAGRRRSQQQIGIVAVSNTRREEVEGPCQPGSVPPMSNRWLIVWRAYWSVTAAKSTGDPPGGASGGDSSSATPMPAWNVPRSRRKWWSTGPNGAIVSTNDVRADHQPRADHELRQRRGPGAPAASCSSLRRGPRMCRSFRRFRGARRFVADRGRPAM